MNKKIFILFIGMFLAMTAQAEELKFVTMLSQPVGVFKQVDLVNADKTSQMTKLAFCQGGKDTCTGTITAQEQVKIPGSLILSGTKSSLNTQFVPTYYVKTFTLYGKNLASNSSEKATLTALTLTAKQFTTGNKVKILIPEHPFAYTKTINSKVAAFNTMSIKNIATLSNTASETGAAASYLTWKQVNCSEITNASAIGGCSDKASDKKRIRVLSGN